MSHELNYIIMTTFILKEGTLNDDTLYIADNGKVFKGGYVALIKLYTFASAWANHEHVKRFRTLETANKFLKKVYNITINEL